MRLAEVEARRFIYRDLTRLIGVLLFGAVVATGVGVFVSSHPPAPADAAKFDAATEEARERLPEVIRQCSRQRPIDQVPEQFRGRLSEEQLRSLSRTRSFSECRSSYAFTSAPTLVPGLPTSETPSLSGGFQLLAFPVAIRFAIFPIWIVSWILGASIIGAEWSAGTQTSLLAWEPRRVRVMIAKSFVPAVLAGLGFVALVLLLFLSVTPTVMLKGTTAGIDSIWWQETLLLTLRGFLLTALGVLLGFGVTMFFRRTIASVGALFGYLMIVETVLRQFTQEPRGWLLTTNFGILATGFDSSGEGRSFWIAALLLGAYTSVLLGLATVLFVRRDAA